MKSLTNPFVTSGYRGARYFCDRKQETEKMLQNITNGRSTTMTAIRRIGKTGLIQHVLSRLPAGYTGVYADILPAESLDDFLNILTSAIFNAVPQRSGPGKRILNFIKSLRPVITYDPLSGQPQVSIDVRRGESAQHIDSVFKFLESYPNKIVIAIDEFQQILQFPEKNTDSWLRSIIQKLRNVIFIFSGSQQHLMNELFADPSRPFYRSTDFLNVGKIELKVYSRFLSKHFKQGGIKISSAVSREMIEWADTHTYYVQLLCNRVFALGSEEIKSDEWKAEAYRILREQEMIFFKYRDLLTIPQWHLMKAIASEGMVFSPTSKDFISDNVLGSPATVLRSLQALQKKEMIYSDFDSQGNSYYKVYDVLFRRWMEIQ